IVEPIATFTTSHPAGQPRVQNIHRIADMLRGTVILPGETFSVNGTVGRRTKANGFVAAPVIEEGRFSEGVGGGISQFATTLFNAAFHGGLDFGEYQSHSIYISRYPYGREATLSYPHPDLQIKNTTPHGVLIWPEYTERTITVTLYSTRFATGEQTGQSESQRGNCTRVTTERTRTYVDGRTKVDQVFATYRPAEGVNC
ncbi:MAG: VanW family protein, partial [Acidimicrobiia bacterium]